MKDLEALGTGLEGVPVPAVPSDLFTGATIGVTGAAVELAELLRASSPPNP